jgi:putative transposase
MPSTHLSLHYHFVFSTKNREPWLTATLRARVHDYLGGILRGLNAHSHRVGGVSDHVHILTGLDAMHRVADVMREIKSESSAWIRRELRIRNFSWQEGYGGFTIGAPDIPKAQRYVFNQEAHHRKENFQSEYLAMLKLGLVKFDDRYLW